MTPILLLALFTAQPLPAIANRLPNGWEAPVSPPATQTAPRAQQDAWSSPFPYVRINPARRAVELDAAVACDMLSPDTPRTELELFVCLPFRDKEHESLLITKAKAAHLHAALLIINLQPGTPARFDFTRPPAEGIGRIPPTGPQLNVRFITTKDGVETEHEPLTWVIDETTGKPPATTLHFTGSTIGKGKNEQGDTVTLYGADELGCLISLCTFGADTIAPAFVISPDSGIDAPRFIANTKAVPPMDTPVKVRITPAG